MLAVLYDIHGNLIALEEVLKDAESAGADRYLLGGDFASWSPWPLETIDRLRVLPHTTWIRGNGERWLREPPLDRPDVAKELAEIDSGLGPEEGWLYSLQSQKELDDGSVDVVCTDLPFGHRTGSHAANRELHEQILDEAARVAAPGARCCLLTHQAGLMDGLIERAGAWTVERRTRVELGGLMPTLFLLRRVV